MDILFAETGTLGVRRAELGRYVADRGSVKVNVAGQDVAVKWGRWGERRESGAGVRGGRRAQRRPPGCLCGR